MNYNNYGYGYAGLWPYYMYNSALPYPYGEAEGVYEDPYDDGYGYGYENELGYGAVNGDGYPSAAACNIDPISQTMTCTYSLNTAADYPVPAVIPTMSSSLPMFF